MHYFKWLGLLLFLLIGIGIGQTWAGFERRRCAEARALLTLIKHIRAQIACFQRPLPAILSALDPALCAACGLPRAPSCFGELLEAGAPFLSEEMHCILAEFNSGLGATYREEQLRACDDCIARLSPPCERLEAELPRRVKLSRLLPLSLCGALILMLI